MRFRNIVIYSLIACTAWAALPTMVDAQVSCPAGSTYAGFIADTSGSGNAAIKCQADGMETRYYTADAADGSHRAGDQVGGIVDADTGAEVNAVPVPPSLVECQDPGAQGYITCALVEVLIGIVSGLISLFTTILDWATQGFTFAIQNTIVDFRGWFNVFEQPVVYAWTLFRDLANIAIIGIFVFIAISIILGLHEYGQKKLIARVVIIAILINFSFLFTLMMVNASNLFASTIYQQLPHTIPGSSTEMGIGQQYAHYMGIASIADTRNLLMQKYNDPKQGFGSMFAYGAFSALFALVAAGVFLYGAILLFIRAVVLIIILLPMASLAFATYLAPSLEESGWKRWWHSLLKQSLLAPVMMLFILISLNFARAVKAGYARELVPLADAAEKPMGAVWETIWIYVLILGSLWAGIYIASQLAGGVASRLAMAGTGSVAGGALGAMAFGGRWGIGRAFDMRAHAKADELKGKEREIAYRKSMGMDTKDLEKAARKLRKQEAFASAQAKRTYDFRNTAVGGLLKGTGGAFTTGTKQNYADIAHHAAEQGAKAGLKVAVDKKTAEKYASEEVRKEYGDVAGAHDKAKQEVDGAKQEISKALLSGEKLALEHENRASTLAQEKAAIEKELQGTTDVDKRSRLQIQMNEKDQHISAARAAATQERTAASQRAASLRTSLSLDQKEADLAQKKEAKKQYDSVVATRARDMMKASNERAKEVAEEQALSPLEQKVGTLGHNRSHHAAELLEKKLPYREAAERRKAIDDFNKSGGHAANDNHAAPDKAAAEHH